MVREVIRLVLDSGESAVVVSGQFKIHCDIVLSLELPFITLRLE
jgi:hypothetical protein